MNTVEQVGGHEDGLKNGRRKHYVYLSLKF